MLASVYSHSHLSVQSLWSCSYLSLRKVSAILKPCLDKRTCLQIGVRDSVRVSDCLFCMRVFVFCMCACHLYIERGVEEREKEIGDRMGDDRLDLITGLE